MNYIAQQADYVKSAVVFILQQLVMSYIGAVKPFWQHVALVNTDHEPTRALLASLK